MSRKRRVITTNTLPQRVCPRCGSQVIKLTRDGVFAYECQKSPVFHWGPWEQSIKKENSSAK